MAGKTQLGVFAKFWKPGQVKTRLAQDTNECFAADIYQAFIQATLESVTGCADTQILAITPPEKLTEFALVIPPDWTLMTQVDGDLGERMQAFFQHAVDHRFEKTVLIGTDSPTLPRTIIQQAFDILDEVDCVLGPAIDGGYYLVGCKTEIPPIFEDICWSTEQVLQQTREALGEARISYELLPPWLDVDTIDDLNNLRDSLQDSGSWLCQRINDLRLEHLS